MSDYLSFAAYCFEEKDPINLIASIMKRSPETILHIRYTPEEYSSDIGAMIPENQSGFFITENPLGTVGLVEVEAEGDLRETYANLLKEGSKTWLRKPTKIYASACSIDQSIQAELQFNMSTGSSLDYYGFLQVFYRPSRKDIFNEEDRIREQLTEWGLSDLLTR